MKKITAFKERFISQFKEWLIIIQQQQSIRVFLKLLKRLRQQHLFFQIITIILLIIFGITIILFFSSYFIWYALKFTFLQILLRGIEWYLNFTEPSSKH